ncbi:MAG TPA: hypothetical protein VI589_09025 [Vicinamibacteria bacterium]
MIRAILSGILAAAVSALASPAFAQDSPPASSAGSNPAVLGPSATSPADATATSPAHWTDAQKEAFLLKAEVVKRRAAPGGITNSRRATLRKDGVEHDAHIQVVDEYKSQINLNSGLELDFRDSWRNNVAAYRLDRLLGLRMIPVTVVRVDEFKTASFTWWVDDVLMTEKERFEKKIKSPDPDAWNRQIFVVRIFDQLIYNIDRNLGNLLIEKDWTIWMIDHTRAFKIFKDLKMEKNLGTSCERDFLASLRTLTKPALVPLMKDLLAEGQVDALLARRDKIVRHYETQIAARGEGSVLYDLPSRP